MNPELTAYIARLAHPKRRAYAEAYAAHLTNGGSKPVPRIDAETAAKIARKVERYAKAAAAVGAEIAESTVSEVKRWAIVEPTKDFTLRTVRYIHSATKPEVTLKTNQRLMLTPDHSGEQFDPRLTFPSAHGLGVPGDPENEVAGLDTPTVNDLAETMRAYASDKGDAELQGLLEALVPSPAATTEQEKLSDYYQPESTPAFVETAEVDVLDLTDLEASHARALALKLARWNGNGKVYAYRNGRRYLHRDVRRIDLNDQTVRDLPNFSDLQGVIQERGVRA